MQPNRLRKDLPGATEPRPMPPGTLGELRDSLSHEELEDLEDLEDYYATLDDDEHREDDAHESEEGGIHRIKP